MSMWTTYDGFSRQALWAGDVVLLHHSEGEGGGNYSYHQPTCAHPPLRFAHMQI